MDDDRQEGQFERLYRRTGPSILAYARRRTDAETADEVVAETFLIAWRRIDELPRDPVPWLYGVACKVLANHRRAAIRRDRLATRAATAVPAAPDPIDGEVLAALASLPEADRELLMLVAWEGLAPAEAARVLGCSANACRIRLHRARRRLDSALAAARPSRSPAAKAGEIS
jgi:RNA polymerase sigma-70 factor (ECF subfamily)